MERDFVINAIVDCIEETDRQDDTRFEEGANFTLWKLAWKLGVQQDVEDELYHRGGGPA